MDINQHELLVDAICGIGFPSMELAVEMEKNGYALFSGNQWNENWVWKKDVLRNMNLADITALYIKLKNPQK